MKNIPTFEYSRKNELVRVIQDVLQNGITKLRQVLFRHGPKKEAAGEKDALADYFDQDVREGVSGLGLETAGSVHIASSPAPRALDTRQVAETALDKGKSVLVNQRLASFDEQDPRMIAQLRILVKYQKKLETMLQAADLDFQDSKEAQVKIKNGIDSAILSHLFDGTLDELGQELDIDEKLDIRTEDFSHNLEEYTQGFLKHLGLLKSDGDAAASLSITHSYAIMSFLRNNLKFIEDGKILAAKDMAGQEFLDRTGGCIAEARGVVLEYKQKGDKKLIKVSGESYAGFIDYE